MCTVTAKNLLSFERMLKSQTTEDVSMCRPVTLPVSAHFNNLTYILVGFLDPCFLPSLFQFTVHNNPLVFFTLDNVYLDHT
jgi:hypothetical protein